MISFLKLIRYKNLLMVLLTMVLTKYALIHSFITNSYLSNLDFSILALSILLITAGGYIINDIYDVEADKINKTNKVFIDVFISKKNAWISYFLMTFIGLCLGVYLSFIKYFNFYSLYFIITIITLFLYSKYLKNKLFLGNFLVAFLCALVIYLIYIFDYWVDEKDFFEFVEIDRIPDIQFVKVFIIFYIIFSFFISLIREIIKDIEDINGDLKIKAKTLPIVIGRKRASKVAFFFSAILLVFLLIILQSLKNEVVFLIYGIIFILLPLLYFLYKLWIAESKKDFSYLSNLMKFIMLFGILSMLLFKFLD
ncbi:MAG: geranylgeranylglycerol-phosphate geranylgeranyltransferase [Polaribacter sp.]